MEQVTDFLHGHHLENQLNDIQGYQNAMLNAVPTSIVITDLYERITFANKEFEALTGYSLQEVLGKDYKILHGSETDLEQVQAISDSLKEAQLFFGEIINYKKDNSIFWNELTISPIFNEKNQLSHFVWVLRDISENKIWKDCLIESERRFRELTDVTPALISQADVHKNIFWFNKSWLSFTGRSFFNEQGMGWINGIHPQDRDPFMNTYNRFFEYRQKFHIEYRLQRADGIYRWLDGHYVPQFSVDGEFVGYVGTCIDITDVRNSQAALDFFNVAHEIIYSTDLNRIILDCNQRFCDLTGYSREEVIGQNVSILKSGMHDTHFYARMWQKINNENSWQGEFINRTKSGGLTTIMTTISVIFDGRDKSQRYLAVGSDITDITIKREYYQKIAYYDNLTGLPNRLLLLDRLNNLINRTKRYGGIFAVLFVDLDGFKAINDHYGHAIGDKFLVSISNQMNKVIRSSDTLARLGGDEFIIVLDGLTGKHDYERTITKLLNMCSSKILLEGVSLKVTASIGACVYPNDMLAEDADAKTVLSYADQAMYVVKNQSKNGYHLFDSNQDQVIVTRTNAIDAIKKGLAQNEFELVYQPKVNMRTGNVLGFEALIRWNNKAGKVCTESFLTILKNHPLGIELGTWVINRALTQLSKWNEIGLETSVSVNIDPRQLYQINFVDGLKIAINNQPNYREGSLEFEILETIALDEHKVISKIINSCFEMGIQFALDDFGKGYSSITYLKDLPITTLKIDRSFIMDMTESDVNLKLVENIINLTIGMEKNVIAEGVETVEQGEILLEFGCEIGQGYAIAEPMAADKVLTWLDDWRPYASWLATPRRNTK
jgi:diguanylate cyclase (GGDEF)-like protein/PAS domain S-box-containing protein